MGINPAWNKNNPLDYARLVELLRYDPETGEFRWIVQRLSYGAKAKIGALAGTLDPLGYRYIGIDGGTVQAHVLAWFYVHKKWPDVQIDHRNMIPDDNRIANLREATMTQQRANQRVRVDSMSGIKGVFRAPNGKYGARICGQHLGRYSTAEEAAAIYAQAAAKRFGEYARS